VGAAPGACPVSDHLYKRGDIWWCWYVDAAGRRHRRTTRQRDRRAAEAVLRRFERAAQSATDPAEDHPDTVAEAVGHLELTADVSAGTKHMIGVKGAHLARLLGTVPLTRLTLDDVQAYCTTRTAESAARETVRKELVTLRQALALAKRRGRYAGDPAVVMPEWRVRYVPRDRWLTREQVAEVCAQLEPHRAAWVVLAAYTGCRRSEVERLTWADVDLAGGWLRVPGTKTAGSRRAVPLADELRAALSSVPADERAGALVEPWPNVVRDLAAACRRAGAPRATPNDLRRTFASWLKQAGIDSMTVGRLLGHTSSRMVELVYGHLDDEAKRRAVATLSPSVTPVYRANAAEAREVREEAKAPSPDHSENGAFMVPRGGIEPPTRGFSIPEIRCAFGVKQGKPAHAKRRA
jgi:integrase